MNSELGWKVLPLKKAGVILIDCDHKTPEAVDEGYPYIAIPQLKDGHIKMDGVNALNHMNGLYIADDSQLMDNHTAVYHAQPYCNSNQLYKGIIGGKAHGVFK